MSNATNTLTGPLQGVRILDMATVLAAPFAATLCGDLGASSVVKAAAQSQTLKRWDCDDLGCVLDVDTVSALEQARQLWQQRMQGV